MSRGEPDLPPLPDQIEGAPHPRETPVLYGQDKAVQSFYDALNSGRVHSGWLISGPRGIGKATLAWKMATSLLSEGPETGALFGDKAPSTLPQTPLPDAHPGLFVLRRSWDDKTKKLRTQITVDDVRGLRKFFALSSTDGGRRVVIVDAADEMNSNAANALLKMLEEPPKGAVMLLVAHQPSRLLPTIRSRCRELRCSPLSTDDAVKALEQTGLHPDGAEGLTALTEGSVGEAIRMIQHGGQALYTEIVDLLSELPNFNRQRAIRLAESCTGKAGEARFALFLDLMDHFLARAARAGLRGEPDLQIVPGEARLLTQICPDANSAREWADVAHSISERARRGKAVNLDPASLVLDTLFKIEATARSVLIQV